MKNLSAPPLTSQGLLLIDKPAGKSSFFLVSLLRRITNIKKIGHAGTLDPFATGVMILLVGPHYTRMQPLFLTADKEYEARIKLGEATDSYDCDGTLQETSETVPTKEAVEEALKDFQGTIQQIPPMFSAKKVKGKKLYELARKGQVIEREPVKITLTTTLIDYSYPYLDLHIRCSKGTYVRSIAHDLGLKLGSYGHLSALTRTKSGSFRLEDCLSVDEITAEGFNYKEHLRCIEHTDLKTYQS